MKKNTGLKVLTGSVITVVVLIMINSGNHRTSAQTKDADPNNLNAAIASQFNDNIRDVAARLQENEKKLARLEAQHQTAQRQVLPEPNRVPLISPDVTNDIDALKAAVAELKASRHDDSTRYTLHRESEMPRKPATTIQDIDQLLIKRDANNHELAYWERLKKTHHSLTMTKKTVVVPKEVDEKKAIPYYTIPAGSDLGHITLLSALIGEVPVEGKLMQPLFPFTALVSRGELMAANGIALPPHLAGMKINGYAIGVDSFLDNISCVRAYVMSALFVFDDGHFVTVGKEQLTSSADMMNNDSLGYLTTAYGNPCIKGHYVTNAPRVLTAMMAADGVKGFGNALSQWQMTYSANTNGITSAPTGSMGQYALGGAAAQGSVKAADWLEKRIQGSFDMVFVPASVPYRTGYRATQLSFHVTQTINLDKNTKGRVLDYGQAQAISYDVSLR